MNAHLRVARPTDNLERLVEMYRSGLDFEVLGSFEGHSGFDGFMLGPSDGGYHLEFTRHRGHAAGDPPSKESLLVFYLPDREEWEMRCARMRAAGFEQVPSWNPYWDRVGATFEDVDGYRIVIQNAAWEAA